MKLGKWALVLGFVAAGGTSCRKHAVQPAVPQNPVVLDSAYVSRSNGGDATAYRFYYDNDGFVVKISIHDIQGVAENISADSLVYDPSHKLQKVIFNSVNGVKENDYLYDNGKLSKIIFDAAQGSQHYMYVVTGTGNRVTALGDYVNNNLDKETVFTYNDDGNVTMEADSTIAGDTAQRYTYDAYDSKPCFGGLLAGVSFFVLPADIFQLQAINNVLRRTNLNTGETWTYTYNYNSTGFPDRAQLISSTGDTTTISLYYKQ